MDGLNGREGDPRPSIYFNRTRSSRTWCVAPVANATN